MTDTIPKIIFQTSKKRPPNYLVYMIKNMCPEWTYIHFTDNDIIRFFKNNYLDEFPNIIEKFNSIKRGEHKADLFRYYFIYLKGGVFLDSDAMLQTNINTLVKDYDFFSVETCKYYCPSAIFQGFLGAKPKNTIIYEALCHVYNVDINELNREYHLLCRFLFNILKKNWEYKIKLYKEIYGSNSVAIIIDDENNNMLVLAHYFKNEKVPFTYLKYEK